MFRLVLVALAAVCLIVNPSSGFAQDSSIDQLKLKLELLEIKLELAEQQAERLAEECEELRKENAKLKGDVKELAGSDKDPFASGVTWSGEAVNSDNVRTIWALTVNERKGRTFEGVVAAINNNGSKFDFKVSGKAPEQGNGLVAFESEQIARGKMLLRGSLKNGVVSLVFSGTTPVGKKFVGSATLRHKQ